MTGSDAILLSHQAHIINQISEILQVRRDSVSRWLKQWETSGLDGLIDKPRSGRTPILDEHDQQRLKELVAEQPHQIRSLQARLQEEIGTYWGFSAKPGSWSPTPPPNQ